MSAGEASEPPRLTDSELGDLHHLVETAMLSGEEDSLPVLGFGEISLILAWPAERPAFACKLLPNFPSRERFESYRETLGDYIAELERNGVRVVPTELRPVELAGGAVAGYVVQPILPAETLAPAVLARTDEASHPLLDAVVETAAAVVGPHLGLDAQLSNWTWDEGRLTYIDVSTPLIWSPDGTCRLDLDVISEPFPPPLRMPLRRFLAPGILDTYRDLRGVDFDVGGNLIKERLQRWLPVFVERANRHLDEPLSVADIERYYRRDRHLWSLLLRVRRLDRSWQRRVRRRPYPYLLPRDRER